MARLMFDACRNLGDFLSLSSSFIKQELFHGQGGNEVSLAHSHDPTEVEQYQNCLEDLPKDITDTMIFHTLSLPDRIRVSSLSKSCRARIKGLPPAPQLPWLLLQRDDLDDKQLRFFDMSTGRVYNCELPSQLQGASFRGSSKGWLLFTKVKRNLFYYITSFLLISQEKLNLELEVFLFNPISKSLHQLPSLEGPTYLTFQLSSVDLDKSIASVVIQGDDCEQLRLAFCRPGVDEKWSILDGQENHDYWCTLFQNGTLYVLRSRTSEEEKIDKLKFNIGGECDCEVNISMIPYDGDDIGIDNRPDIIIEVDNENENGIGEEEEDSNRIVVVKNDLSDPYLVESTDGELLMIVKITDVFGNSMQLENIGTSDEVFHYFGSKTSAFEVYKMDPHSGEFRRVDDIGDQVIFLTLFGSQSCSATDFEGVGRNCIYFAEDEKHIHRDESISIASRDSGVYYINERRIERCFPSVYSDTEDLMSWFAPYF